MKTTQSQQRSVSDLDVVHALARLVQRMDPCVEMGHGKVQNMTLILVR